MKPVPCPDRREPSPLVAPSARLADIIATLTARMSDVQRHAFLAKMSELDRQLHALSPFTVTLGSA